MDEREELRMKLQEKYNKPVFFVHELIYCPHYRTRVPQRIVEEKMELGRKIHENIERYFTAHFGYYEREKTLILDRGKYILVGHADLINHKDKLVIEIKPHLGKDVRHIYQLSAYVSMFNEIYGGHYYGAFLVYVYNKEKNSVKWSIVKPFYLIMNILDLIDRVAEIKIEKGDIRIGSMMCNECILKEDCRPDIVYKHRNGFVDVSVPNQK